jgi:two-component system, chemotaxis family, response regulator WspF
MRPLRIAIVNDTLMSLEVLRRMIAAVPQYQLAWTAQNGVEAVERCAADRPDLVLMDLLMPIMDGVEATKRIMAQSPCAILLVTASVNRFAGQVFEAMGHGALDAINTPILGLDFDSANAQALSENRLLKKIATVAKFLGKSPVAGFPLAGPRSSEQSTVALPRLLLIGASTGGPQAIAQILSQIPENQNLAVIVVQHVDVQFVAGLVDWLNQQSLMPVRLSQSGARILPGEVIVAGSDRHLVISRNQTLYHRSNTTGGIYCPSVDMLFQSAAANWPQPGVGVLLTGMGRDGAIGMQQLITMGWTTIAQDQATSVVYGMPKAAVDLHAAAQVLPINAIAAAALARLSKVSL